MKRAIVLSGGGAKGSYQVGVWKALRKLGIDYDIVTGTSIGSVNGLMMVQKDFWKTLWMWSNIGFDVMYNEAFPSKYDTLLERTAIYKNYMKYFLKNGGMSMGKMRNLLETTLYDRRKFHSSSVDFGIVTFNLSTMKPVIKTKKDLKGDDVIEYVLASGCCYPAFQKVKIGENEYIDGGYHDNFPINLAIDMGAEEVIAVDLDALGLRKKIKDENVKVTIIAPRNNLGSFLIFDKGLARRGIRYGYNDTMKVFHRLDGDKYTFKYGYLERNYQYYREAFLKQCEAILSVSKKDQSIYDSVLKLSVFKRILGSKKDYEIRKIFNQNIEFLGKVFGIDDSKIYSMMHFHVLLKEKLSDTEGMSWEFVEKKLKAKAFRELFQTAAIVKYFYYMLKHDYKHKDICRVACVFPKEFLGALYLTLLF